MTQIEIIILYFIRLLKYNSELILPIKPKLPTLKEYLTNELSIRDIAMKIIKCSRKDSTLRNQLKQVLIDKEVDFPEIEELLLTKYSTEEEKIENVFKIPLQDAINQYLEINGYPSDLEISSSKDDKPDNNFHERKRRWKKK